MAEASQYYERCGFRYTEVPWAVPEHIMMITSPGDATLFPLYGGNMLVASAEQSFLHLIEEGKIVNAGKYQTITPCFRDDVEDEIHKKYFLKNELMIFRPSDPEADLKWLIDIALTYTKDVARGHRINVVPGSRPDERDITVNGVEVGSYGVRTHRDYTWVYGTGLAEPRMSIAMSMAESL